MNSPNNNVPPYTQPSASNALQPHPLRAWHIMYTVLGMLIVAVFVVGGLQVALYETSSARGSMAGFAVAILLLYGVVVCVALGAVALVTLPFYIMARKKVTPSTLDVPKKQVRLGLVAAIIVFGAVLALVSLIIASFIVP